MADEPPTWFEIPPLCKAVFQAGAGQSGCELPEDHDGDHRSGPWVWGYIEARIIHDIGDGNYSIELSTGDVDTIGPVEISFRNED